MDEPIGAVARQKRQNRLRAEVLILVVMIIAAIAYFIYSNNPTRSEGVLAITMGPGAKMEAVFIGPSELKVQWDNIAGHEWSIALVQGRIRNISPRTVSFDDIIYRVTDKEGRTLWQESDARFSGGGRLASTEYFNFATQPISNKDSKRFEVIVEHPRVS